MKRFGILAVFIAVLAVSALVFAAVETGNVLDKLIMGNKNFVSGTLSKKDLGDARRKELTKGQHPFATVLTCSDSRVSPELLFDQGLGDIFVVRSAGNVVDPIEIGSIEYAVEHLHTPLLVIMGHQSCGAVKAAMEAKGESEGNIGAILKKIMPAVEKANASGAKDPAQKLNLAVQENVKNVYADLLSRSPILKEMVHEGKLKVVLAEYYLDSGKVDLLPEQKAHYHHK